jgi:MFS family permease
VNLVNTVFFLTLFVCEIPTGAFADIFGRKTSFVTACALICSSMLIYGCSHSFLGFAAAEMIAAIGSTFRSGAFQAWLVDSLRHHGYEGEYNHIFGCENLICQIGGGIGAVVGSYISVYDPALPWFLGGTIMAITTIYAYIVMKEDYFVRSTFSWKRGLRSMRDVAVSSIKYGTDHQAVRFILVITCVQIFAIQALNMYWQPFFREHKVSEQHLGFMFMGIMIALAIGAFIISRSNCQGKEKKMIIQTQIYAGVLTIITTLIPNLPMIIVLFLLQEVPRGCWKPLIDSYLQKRIPSHERATIASFCAIAPHIGGVFGLITSGLIAQFFGISVAWIVAGIFLIIGSLLASKGFDSSSDI